MKILKTLSIALFVSLLAFTSCKKEDDNGGSSTSSAVVDGEKINACEFCITSAWTSSSFQVNLSATSDGSSAKTISLSMPGKPEKGTHDLTSTSDYSASYTDGESVYSTKMDGDGTIEITEITYDGDDVDEMTVKFSFTAKNSSDESVEVTDGIIYY